VAESSGQPLDEVLQVSMLQSPPHFFVLVVLERIQVDPEGAREKHRVLRNDGQSGAKGVQTQFGDVDVVNQDRTTGSLNDAEQAEGQGRFASTSTSNNSNLKIPSMSINLKSLSFMKV